MQIHFYKYQGCGNDFVILDNRNQNTKLSTQQIKQLCNRHFGIGADGLMLLENQVGYDFKMVYFNSDGNASSMCGNGGRCITAFANKLQIVQNKAHFMAVDGEHIATIYQNEIALKMNDVSSIETKQDYFFLNTGSPHVVKWVDNIDDYPVFEQGKAIRYNDTYKVEGTNVNFIEQNNNGIYVRTYERGVEDETLACGTGVTASALVAALLDKSHHAASCNVKTLGGNLTVTFTKHSNNSFTDIWLKGPAVFIFEGDVEI